MDNLEKFLNQLRNEELEPYLKSEPIPDQDGPVTVAVAKNFEEVVTNTDKDVLIEFYAPWCGHCKNLAPTYDKLGEQVSQGCWRGNNLFIPLLFGLICLPIMLTHVFKNKNLQYYCIEILSLL